MIVRINLGDTSKDEVKGEVVCAIEITDEGDIKMYIEEDSPFGIKAMTEVLRLLVVQLDTKLTQIEARN